MQFGKRVPRQSTNVVEPSSIQQLVTDMMLHGDVGEPQDPIHTGRIDDEPKVESLQRPITSGPLGELYNSADEWERNYSNDILMQQAAEAELPGGGMTLDQQKHIQSAIDQMPHATDEDMFRQDNVMNTLREYYRTEPAYNKAHGLYEEQQRMEKRTRAPHQKVRKTQRDRDLDKELEESPSGNEWVK